MVIRIQTFRGEVPMLMPRNLPQDCAQRAVNCRFEGGALQPTRQPLLVTTLGGAAQTIYRTTGGAWLSWNALVDVAPGPVASDRLYITGDGAPKVRTPGGVTRDLALPTPTLTPKTRILKNDEYLTVGNKELRIANRHYAKTSTGVDVNISVAGTTATVTLSHTTGISAAAAATLVNSLRYRQPVATPIVASALKVVWIESIRDNGGQQYDANRNPLGSDTRYLEVGCKIFCGGTPLDIDLPDPGTLDGTDEAGQNDPPTLTATALNPTYVAGQAATAIFSGAAVGTVEGGQLINRIVLRIEGLSNSNVDASLSIDLAYVYTHVTDLDEESAPSPLSVALGWSPGHSVVVSGFSTGSTGRGVNRYRIYRSQVSSLGETELHFVAEIARLTTYHVDVVDVATPQEPLTTADFSTPPDGLTGIVAMPNGIMAGFVGKDLYFSEPWKPHAWPAKYVLQTQHAIVGLASVGAALAVLTAGQPSLVQGSHPANMRQELIEVTLPCVNKRGIVDLGYAVAYPTPDGLAVLDAAGATRIATDSLFTPRQWKIDLGVSTFVAARFDQYYVVSHVPAAPGSPRQTMMIDMTGANPTLVRFADQPLAWFVDPATGEAYFLRAGNEIAAFEPASGPVATYEWRSKLFVDPYDTNIGAIQIECDRRYDAPVQAEVYADGVLRATVTTPNRILPLPSGFRAREWELRLTGQHIVHAVTLAHTAEEIARLS